MVNSRSAHRRVNGFCFIFLNHCVPGCLAAVLYLSDGLERQVFFEQWLKSVVESFLEKRTG
jgi:hypothetical protein